MTTAWPLLALDDVALLEYGTRVTRKKDGGTIYPVYGGGGATFRLDEWNREDCYIISRFAMSRECVRFVPGRFFLNDSGLTVSTRDSNSLTQDFLDLFLLAKSQDIFDLSRGTAQRNLDVPAFRMLEVPLPPLDEQKRIVAKLDAAQQEFDRLNNDLEQQLSQLTDFDNALLSEMLESPHQTPEPAVTTKWPTLPLGTLFKTSSGATPLKSRKDFYQDGKIPWLLSGEVSQGSINNARNFITEKALTETAAKLFPINSVLVAMYGATAGQVGLLGFESATNQAVCAIYPSPDYLPRFVYYALLSMKEVLVSQAVGNAQPNVSQAKIKDLPFPVVSLDEQKRIVAKLHEISLATSSLRSNILDRKKSAVELQSGILAAAFAGAL